MEASTKATAKKAVRIGWAAVWLAGAAAVGGVAGGGCGDSAPEVICGSSNDASAPPCSGDAGETGGALGGVPSPFLSEGSLIALFS